jgi:hypothetical protein
MTRDLAEDVEVLLLPPQPVLFARNLFLGFVTNAILWSMLFIP